MKLKRKEVRRESTAKKLAKSNMTVFKVVIYKDKKIDDIVFRAFEGTLEVYPEDLSINEEATILL